MHSNITTNSRPYSRFSEIPRIFNKIPQKIDIYYNPTEIDKNYSNIVLIEQQKYEKDISYYRSYLYHLYNCEKSEEEIVRILKTIKTIKNTVKNELLFLDVDVRKIVLGVVCKNNFFYERRTQDTHIKLYRMEYNGQKSILKCYFYFPDFSYSCNMQENRFINEVVFQNYAGTISHKYNFISPIIYTYGKLVILKSIIDEYNNDSNTSYYGEDKHGDKSKVKCMFIIMEDIVGLSLKFGEFTPESCMDIYEIDRTLKCELLSHNDLYKRNIIVPSINNKMIVLDYGEATLCGTPFKDY